MQSKEGGKGTEGKEGGRQTKTDRGRFFNIRHLLKPQMSIDWIEADEVSGEGERKRQWERATKT